MGIFICRRFWWWRRISMHEHDQILMNCGFTIFGITDYVGFKNTLHYGAVCAKAPRDEMDKMACRRLGLRLAEFVGLYICGRKDCHPLVSSKARDLERWGYPGIPPRDATMDALIDMNKQPHVSGGNILKVPPTLGKKTMSTLSLDSLVVGSGMAGPSLVCGIKRKTVLIFTKATDYVHGSLPAAAAFFGAACKTLGWEPVISDESALLESPSTQDFDVIVFVNNSGELFNPKLEVLSKHIAKGKGIIGVHAALASFLDGEDAEGQTKLGYTSPIIQDIFGAHFLNHPPVQTATVNLHRKEVQNFSPELYSLLPETFEHCDEFFNYSKNPAENPNIHVLASVDESTYKGGLMGKNHPVIWYQHLGPAKAPIFYTALGHFSHFYNGQGADHVATFLRAGLRFVAGENIPNESVNENKTNEFIESN